MSYALVVQSEAIIDLQEVFEWYQTKRQGLGFEFIEEIEIGYEKICNNPHYFTAINKQFRRLKISRFPYLIVYEVLQKTVIVNSVRHVKRKSKL